MTAGERARAERIIADYFFPVISQIGARCNLSKDSSGAKVTLSLSPSRSCGRLKESILLILLQNIMNPVLRETRLASVIGTPVCNALTSREALLPYATPLRKAIPRFWHAASICCESI